MKVNYEKVLDKLYSEFDRDGSIKKNIQEVIETEWTLGNIPEKIKNLYVALIGIVAGVEWFSLEVEKLQSKQKRKMVAKFLDGCIEGGWLFEKIDGFVINRLIDLFIAMLNEKYGKEWYIVVKDILNKELLPDEQFKEVQGDGPAMHESNV